jgi:hypothetical protein
MKRSLFVWIILLAFTSGGCLYGIGIQNTRTFISDINEQDTLNENQNLYSGKVWKNMYRRINGDQFLFTNYFLPGTVSAYGKTFGNLLIRYDIFSDEIMIPVDREEIVQLNKEMIDSFSITFENKVYNFSKVNDERLNTNKGAKGYFYVLYNHESALYVKFKKDISPHTTDKSDGTFLQTQKIYLVNDNSVHPLSGTNDLFRALKTDEVKIKNWLKTNKLKVSKKRPESFVPAIRFYDSLHQ